jgi:hypothetical protein
MKLLNDRQDLEVSRLIHQGLDKRELGTYQQPVRLRLLGSEAPGFFRRGMSLQGYENHYLPT